MTNICRFTIPASRDIESIIDYVASNHNFNTADKLLNKINDKCRRLADFPNMGRKRDELYPSLRSFPVDDYLIFYCLIEGGIEIQRVVSGFRDLDELFGKQSED